MEILTNVLVAIHLLGMAAIVGSFFVQMRRKGDFVLGPLLWGAIAQVVTGLALVGLAEAGDGDPLNYAKIGVKATIATVVLVAAIFAVVTQRKGKRVQPWFHAAGGLAVVNVFVAVLWH
ncbi:MAG: hypothetical protein ABL886_10165 [Rhodoglobus sp.]